MRRCRAMSSPSLHKTAPHLSPFRQKHMPLLMFVTAMTTLLCSTKLLTSLKYRRMNGPLLQPLGYAVCICLCLCVCMCMCVYVCVCVHACARVCVCVCVCVYVHVCTYVYVQWSKMYSIIAYGTIVILFYYFLSYYVCTYFFHLSLKVSDNDLSVENQNSTLAITGGDDSNRFYLEAADEPNAWFLHVVDLDFDNTLPNPRVINIMVTNEGVTLTGLCHNVCPLETLVAMTTVTVTVNVSVHNCHTPWLACTGIHQRYLLYLSLVHTHMKYAHTHM